LERFTSIKTFQAKSLMSTLTLKHSGTNVKSKFGLMAKL